jgi:hypothetical protein
MQSACDYSRAIDGYLGEGLDRESIRVCERRISRAGDTRVE